MKTKWLMWLCIVVWAFPAFQWAHQKMDEDRVRSCIEDSGHFVFDKDARTNGKLWCQLP